MDDDSRETRDALTGRALTPPWPLIALAWAVPAAFATIPYWLRRFTPIDAAMLGLDLSRWIYWALLTPVIFILAERFPLQRGRFARALLIHVIAAILMAIVVETTWYQVARIARGLLEPVRVVTMSGGRVVTGTQAMILSVAARIGISIMAYAVTVAAAFTVSYNRRLRERELHAARLETELATAHVQALKMQLHPHFLFNTLHAVNVLIPRDPAGATRMVSRLGDLLRLTLSRAAQAEVQLADELRLLELYFEIERTRFQDRLSIEYDVDPAAQAALVPDLILQPLAENAIRHGVAKLPGPARITVRARARGDQLVLEVQDNGRGLPADDQRQDGVGLRSTRDRLRHLYGRAQTLDLVRPSEGGCLIRIAMPFHKVSSPLAAAANA